MGFVAEVDVPALVMSYPEQMRWLYPLTFASGRQQVLI